MRGWEREGRVGGKGVGEGGKEGGQRETKEDRGKGKREKGSRNEVRKITGRKSEEGKRTKHSSLCTLSIFSKECVHFLLVIDYWLCKHKRVLHNQPAILRNLDKSD